MKKIIIFLTIVTLFVIGFSSIPSTGVASSIDVYVNKQKVKYDTEPLIVNGRTMVPIRHTMEALGANIHWDNKNKIVKITKENKEVELKIDSKIAYRNGSSFTLDSAPFIKNNRTYVPLRFISEGFNYAIKWDSKSRQVSVADENHKALLQDPIPVLMYHHLTNSKVDGSNIPPERFQQHMEAIKAEGYTTITDYDLYNFLQYDKPLPKKPILITFDDGYKSNYTYAYPVLKKLGMKATVNLLVSRVEGDKNLYPNETPKISWEEARESQDVFLFQGHTYDLHYKGKNTNGKMSGMITGRMLKSNGEMETQKEFESRLLKDLTVSKEKIEQELGKEVITLAYPYGNYSEDTIKIAKKAGYKMAFTVKSGKVNPNNAELFELNRITAHGSMSAKQLIEEINQY